MFLCFRRADPFPTSFSRFLWSFKIRIRISCMNRNQGNIRVRITLPKSNKKWFVYCLWNTSNVQLLYVGKNNGYFFLRVCFFFLPIPETKSESEDPETLSTFFAFCFLFSLSDSDDDPITSLLASESEQELIFTSW